MLKIIVVTVVLLMPIAAICDSTKTEEENYDSTMTPTSKKELNNMSGSGFTITSPVFTNDGFIPKGFTCDGKDISPELSFNNIPSSCKSIALICDDPDAPGRTWIHWVIFNLPTGLNMSENIEKKIRPNIGQDSTDIQPIQGINDFGRIGYGGPCPPKGPAHRYFFKLYALDTVLNFEEEDIQKGITKKMLLKAMEGHILSESVLMGRYKR